jgi:hypothetical protein
MVHSAVEINGSTHETIRNIKVAPSSDQFEKTEFLPSEA